MRAQERRRNPLVFVDEYVIYIILKVLRSAHTRARGMLNLGFDLCCVLIDGPRLHWALTRGRHVLFEIQQDQRRLSVQPRRVPSGHRGVLRLYSGTRPGVAPRTDTWRDASPPRGTQSQGAPGATGGSRPSRPGARSPRGAQQVAPCVHLVSHEIVPLHDVASRTRAPRPLCTPGRAPGLTLGKRCKCTYDSKDLHALNGCSV
jgi:hypothetical protein